MRNLKIAALLLMLIVPEVAFSQGLLQQAGKNIVNKATNTAEKNIQKGVDNKVEKGVNKALDKLLGPDGSSTSTQAKSNATQQAQGDQSATGQGNVTNITINNMGGSGSSDASAMSALGALGMFGGMGGSDASGMGDLSGLSMLGGFMGMSADSLMTIGTWKESGNDIIVVMSMGIVSMETVSTYDGEKCTKSIATITYPTEEMAKAAYMDTIEEDPEAAKKATLKENKVITDNTEEQAETSKTDYLAGISLVCKKVE